MDRLPDDILLEIFLSCELVDFPALAMSCRKFANIIRSEKFWKQVFHQRTLFWESSSTERRLTLWTKYLEDLQKDPKFSWRQLTKSMPQFLPKFYDEDHQKIADYDGGHFIHNGYGVDKLYHPSETVFVVSQQKYREGIVVVKLWLEYYPSLQVPAGTTVGFSEHKRIDFLNTISQHKNWGITALGTAWNCGNYAFIDRTYSHGDFLTLVLNFEDGTLTYYKNNHLHHKFTDVSSSTGLYFTVALRESCDLIILPALPFDSVSIPPTALSLPEIF